MKIDQHFRLLVNKDYHHYFGEVLGKNSVLFFFTHDHCMHILRTGPHATSPKNLTSYLRAYSMTTVKFCMVIKLDVRKILQDQRGMLMRDLFAVANFLVISLVYVICELPYLWLSDVS